MQLPQDWQQALAFLARRQRRGARPRGLRADVEDVGPGPFHLERQVERAGRVVGRTAVGE